jgi:glucosamine--fructose-6-phosphate aminotransferase (isomerizing)
MVEPNFPVFVFAPTGVTSPALLEAIAKLKALQAETVVITDAGNPLAAGAATRIIRLPQRMRELYTPIPYIIPAQIFAACLAGQKGLNPDHPRTLTKVTLTL